MLASSASSSPSLESSHTGSREIQSVQRSLNGSGSGSGSGSGRRADSPPSVRVHPDVPQVEDVAKDGGDYPKFNDMPGWKVFLILLSLGLALFMFALEETIVATSVSTIGASLNIRDSLSWIATSYLLTATVIQPITGRLADAFGTKPLLLVALWIFVVGNIIAGTAKGLGQILAGRLISGVGGAGLLSLVGIIISMLTNERQRSTYMNLVNVTFLVSDALGPTLGGVLAKAGQWRWIFLLNAPIGPVITVIILLFLQVPPSSAHIKSVSDGLRRMDVLGMTFLVSMLSFIIVCLNIGGQTAPWDSPLVIGMFCAAGVCLGVFIVVEKYAELPVVPIHLFAEWKWRNVPIMTVNRTLLFFHTFALIFYLPMLLQVTGTEEIVAAALVVPFCSVAGISSTIASWVVHKYGHVRPFLLGSYVILPVGLGLLSTVDEHSSLGKIIGFTLIAGVAFGWTTQLEH